MSSSKCQIERRLARAKEEALTQLAILVIVKESEVTERCWLEMGPVPTARTPRTHAPSVGKSHVGELGMIALELTSFEESVAKAAPHATSLRPVGVEMYLGEQSVGRCGKREGRRENTRAQGEA